MKATLQFMLIMLAAGGAPFSGMADEPRTDVAADAATDAIERGLDWLAAEVPRWHREHSCFSCHHNGDAARVLYRLRKDAGPKDTPILADTTAWLAQPPQWKNNHGDERFADLTLANLQFAAALEAAVESGVIADERTLVHAAELLAGDQQTDGTWKTGAPGTVGSPITWGRFLTAAIARDVLIRADREHFAAHIARIDHFVRTTEPRTVVDAAGCLLALGTAGDTAAVRQRKAALEVIRAAAASDGGWGPYRNAPLEPFDTAIVLLALSELRPADRPGEFASMLAGGRQYLQRTQLPDGSWPATTRPPDRESYAHRTSTTAWAVLALATVKARATE